MILPRWVFAATVVLQSTVAHANISVSPPQNTCAIRLEGSSALTEPELVAKWSKSLSHVFFAETTLTPRASHLQRLRYKAAFYVLKKTLNDLDVTRSDLEYQLGEALRARAENNLLRTTLGEAHRNVLVGGAKQLPKLHETMRQMLQLANETYPNFSSSFYLYRKTYGPALFTEDAFRTALMNVYAMRLFQKIESREDLEKLPAIDAAALLHPVFDGPEDRGEITPESLANIAKAVSGHPVLGESEFERAILSLIRTIYEAYPPALHPRLKWIFANLLRAQQASEGQKGSVELSDRELFKLTVMKGGLSTSLFAYVGLGGLTDAQFEFYFRAGTLFQLLDDFNDAAVDREAGIRTLFSGVDDPNAWVENALRLLSLWRNLDELARQDSVMNFLSISFFSQTMAGIGLLPPTFRSKIIAAAASSLFGINGARAERLFHKLTACMRFSLDRIESPFFSEIDQFLWKGEERAPESLMSSRNKDVVSGCVDQLRGVRRVSDSMRSSVER